MTLHQKKKKKKIKRIYHLYGPTGGWIIHRSGDCHVARVPSSASVDGMWVDSLVGALDHVSNTAEDFASQLVPEQRAYSAATSTGWKIHNSYGRLLATVPFGMRDPEMSARLLVRAVDWLTVYHAKLGAKTRRQRGKRSTDKKSAA